MVSKIDKQFVIALFKRNRDNTAPIIAKKVGLKKYQVDRIINNHLTPKINTIKLKSKCDVKNTFVR